MSSLLVEHLLRRIQQDGPISFYDYMEEVLYHPEFGYYSSVRNPLGREGDFYTSADVDPIFGALIARKFATMASETGVAPENFTIVELGAGTGVLAREILRRQPFPYRIIERSAAMRARQQQTLAGRRVEWTEDLPENLTGCVFS